MSRRISPLASVIIKYLFSLSSMMLYSVEQAILLRRGGANRCELSAMLVTDKESDNSYTSTDEV